MMKCNIKKMALAVGTVLGGLSMVPSAQAVNLATDGLGQSLIFPITPLAPAGTPCSTSPTPAIRLWRSKCASTRATTRAMCLTSTWSCRRRMSGTARCRTVPAMCRSSRPPIPPARSPDSGRRAAFQGSGANGILAYTNVPGGVQAADGGPADTDRMREGYVTMTMMGSSPPSGLAAGAIHTAARVPVNCGVLQSLFSLNGYTFAQLQGAFPATSPIL